MNAEVDVAATGRRPPTREDRAAIALMLLATFVAVIWLIVATGARPALPVLFLVAMVQPQMLLVLCVIAAWGLRQRRPWAVAACTPILVILLVAGLVSFVVALLQARLEIPLEAVLAWWALRAAPEARSEPRRAGAGAWLMVGGLLLVNLLPLLTPVALTPGGPLVVSESDLDASMTVDCGPTTNASPESIVVTYSWSWRRAELVAGGTDEVVVSWFGSGDAGSYTYSLAATELGQGLSEANRVLDPAASILVAVDMATNRFQPGQLRLTLERGVDLASPHGSIELRSRYAHAPADIYDPASAAQWHVDKPSRCTW
jgi:hypothetical protein